MLLLILLIKSIGYFSFLIVDYFIVGAYIKNNIVLNYDHSIVKRFHFYK